MVSFIESNATIHSKFLTDTDREAGKLNDVFVVWNKLDQMMMCWMTESMSSEVQAQMVGCTSSSEVWVPPNVA